LSESVNGVWHKRLYSPDKPRSPSHGKARRRRARDAFDVSIFRDFHDEGLAQPVHRALALEKSARPQYRKAIKAAAKKITKVSRIQSQQDIRPRERAKKNGTIFASTEDSGTV